jgi:hypothetical protein
MHNKVPSTMVPSMPVTFSSVKSTPPRTSQNANNGSLGRVGVSATFPGFFSELRTEYVSAEQTVALEYHCPQAIQLARYQPSTVPGPVHAAKSDGR